MLRAELCVQRNMTLYGRAATSYVGVQQPLVAQSGRAAFDSGAQQDEAAVTLPQLADCSPAAGSSAPNRGIEPSDRKLSHAIPCGSVTQYLSDFA
jgi:hypothetical protein